MARARIPAQAGADAVAASLEGASDRETVALATRYLLQVLTDIAPGNTLEVRVPPYGAAQVVEGPRHTRGTPPNVVEMDPATWIAVATGRESWDAALADARATASGTRADLGGIVPVPWEA